jgi:DNA repair photolyase
MKYEVVEKKLRQLSIKFSGRSSDYISPTFLQGCYGGCIYCYAARHFPDKFYNKIAVSTNTSTILKAIHDFDTSSIVKPNQTHEYYITWDIACNADIVPFLDQINSDEIFEYFVNSERDFATFATKFVNKKLLTYNPDRKIRVRMSLMPQVASKHLEPNTAGIDKRIEYINYLYKQGYEVHINFSPVVWYPGWVNDYEQLFIDIDNKLETEVKEQLACEIIFLTHNEKLHQYNIEQGKKFESVLWQPNMQENKTSSFGGDNIRYERNIKSSLLTEFVTLLSRRMPYCKIRYAF